MKLLSSVLFLALGVFAYATPATQVCPCGFVNDLSSNPNCTTFIEDAKVGQTGFCAENGTNDDEDQSLCFVNGDGEAKCRCNCGWKGDLCSEKVEINVTTGVLFLVFSLGVLGCSVAYNIWRARTKGTDDWKFNGDQCSTPPQPWVSDKVLLAYRFAAFAIGFGFLVTLLDTPRIFVAFTVWNWTIFTVYFGIGTYLSLRKVLKTERKVEHLTKPEKAFIVLLNLELPSTFLICAVVWLVLYPAAVSVDANLDGVLNPFSFLSHAANVAFFLVDFFFSGLYIRLHYFVYTVMWGSTYIAFHTVYQFVREAQSKDHCPVYGFLTLDQEPLFAIIWAFGLLFVYFLFFLIGLLVSKFKEKRYARFQENEVKVSA
mmetsp:Transcript_4372/g.5070  ORF Transcript_4372/g.5070 Transcript_4372/m.5070 type:complete len:372 (-) Transcript_4372:1162-2277(-)